MNWLVQVLGHGLVIKPAQLGWDMDGEGKLPAP